MLRRQPHRKGGAFVLKRPHCATLRLLLRPGSRGSHASGCSACAGEFRIRIVFSFGSPRFLTNARHGGTFCRFAWCAMAAAFAAARFREKGKF